MVWTGSTVGTLTEVACQDFVHGGDADTFFKATAGTTYRIQLGGGTDTVDLSVVDLRTPPTTAGGRGRPALSIASPPFVSSIKDIRGATTSHEPFPGVRQYRAVSVWFKYTPTIHHVVRVDTSGSDFQGFVAIYTGSALTYKACGFSGNIAFDAKPGTTYYIRPAATTPANTESCSSRLPECHASEQRRIRVCRGHRQPALERSGRPRRSRRARRRASRTRRAAHRPMRRSGTATSLAGLKRFASTRAAASIRSMPSTPDQRSVA